jgi:hypothetical protein
MFSFKKCLKKGGIAFGVFFVTFVGSQLVANNPELANMTIEELTKLILDAKGIGAITVGSIITMLINYIKNKNKEVVSE